MTKYLLAGAAALAFGTSPAVAAATFTVGTGTDKPLIAANDFKTQLEGLGLNNLRNFAGLTLDGPAKIKVELFGSESGADDRIILPGLTYTQGPDVPFGPVLLGTLTFANAADFSIKFSSSLSGFLTEHSPGAGEFGYFLKSSDNGTAVTTSVLWLGYDNQLTQVDDDNHDDLVIRLTATAVPEPAAWALMIGGFALVGLTARRRRVAIAYA